MAILTMQWGPRPGAASCYYGPSNFMALDSACQQNARRRRGASHDAVARRGGGRGEFLLEGHHTRGGRRREEAGATGLQPSPRVQNGYERRVSSATASEGVLYRVRGKLVNSQNADVSKGKLVNSKTRLGPR